MKLTFKGYKKKRIETLLNSKNFLIICNSASVDSKEWRKIYQGLFELGIKTEKVTNGLFKNAIKNTKFYYFNGLFNGSILLLTVDNKGKTDLMKLLNQLKRHKNVISILGIKINNQIYSLNQIKKLNTLNYSTNLKLLYNSLHKTLKLPSVQLLKYYSLNT